MRLQLSMVTEDNLTRDSLTRDEAREAIEILILRKDNSDNLLIGLSAIDVALIAILITLFSNLHSLLISKSLLSIVFAIIILIVLVAVLYISLLIRKTVKSEKSKSKYIKNRIDKLAKNHGLEDFKNSIASEKEW